MPQTYHDEEDYRDDDIDADDDEADVDREGPDPSEMDASDDPDLEICPHCRKLISEDAERCHHCGMYLSAEDTRLSKPAWFLIAVIVTLLIVLLVWIF